jgi:hypothetical protein
MTMTIVHKETTETEKHYEVIAYRKEEEDNDFFVPTKAGFYVGKLPPLHEIAQQVKSMGFDTFEIIETTTKISRYEI